MLIDLFVNFIVLLSCLDGLFPLSESKSPDGAIRFIQHRRNLYDVNGGGMGVC